jgi:hypothetical protein
MPRRHPGWLPLILTHNFLDTPNRQTLSKVLKECANGGWEPSHKSYLSLLPWPLAACLDAVGSGQELQALAAQVEQSALGDTAEWKAAEERWKSQGITPEDFAQRPTGLQPFDSSIADWGFPPCFGWSITFADYPDALNDQRLLQDSWLLPPPGMPWLLFCPLPPGYAGQEPSMSRGKRVSCVTLLAVLQPSAMFLDMSHRESTSPYFAFHRESPAGPAEHFSVTPQPKDAEGRVNLATQAQHRYNGR